MQIRYGSSKVVELEAGKPTILGGKSEADLINILEQVAADIRGGKFHNQINEARNRAMRAKAA